LQLAKQLVVSLICDKSLSEVLDNRELPHFENLVKLLMHTLFKSLDKDQILEMRAWWRRTKGGDHDPACLLE